MPLYEALSHLVDEWRQQGHPHGDYDTISEILLWARSPEGEGFRLRPPQLRALETYWYLRLVKKTPRIFDLYQEFFPASEDPDALLKALGVPDAAFKESKYEFKSLWENIRTDDQFVKKFKLEALRETLGLDYPSYILALAMGAGKTILIGAIFASEFAMAFEYPQGPFVQNALVFAPGKTIIESLRQLAETHFERILPPRLFKQFAASLKLTFTRDGERDIPVTRASLFNVIVTNTEKIRIQKESIRKADLGGLFARDKEEEARQEVANLRLQAIASLPHLAVFSDEAHHTYGQSLNTELKKVRKTVDYLAVNTNVVCVINTTGTPYFQKQPLRDVVIWYSLSEGIRDQILKEVKDDIRAYDFDDNVEDYVSHVVVDFFKDYRDVTLLDGTPAKLAMYFPQTADVAALRPVIDTKLVELGLSPTVVIEHHTSNENKADFDRFKSKDSQHRIALLVDRGVEGWDVPALFACALARKLKTSNNFVLQAASRCLRQVPGNNMAARIYLSSDNKSALDKELAENYGETLSDLIHVSSKSRGAIVRLRKLNIPSLVVKQLVRTVVRKKYDEKTLVLNRPKASAEATMRITTLTLGTQQVAKGVLQQTTDTVEVAAMAKTIDLYAAAVELAAIYRVELLAVLNELRRIYSGESQLPLVHLPMLQIQIEKQTCKYEVVEEKREVALALVKPEGFDRTIEADGKEVYTAEISYPVSREHLIAYYEKWKVRSGKFSFHYDPYNFDSNPEMGYLQDVLTHLTAGHGMIEDIYFTGGFTDARKTDFRVEYKDEDGKWRDYTPDFVLRCTNGKCLIVEIKDARFEASTLDDLARHSRGDAIVTREGRKAIALKKWTELQPEQLKYELLFASSNQIDYQKLAKTREFIKKC
jgi:type III restriction enzyme